MDTGNHMVQGFISHYTIGLIFNKPFTFGLSGLVIGGLPDLIGEYMARIKKDNYVWYNKAHKGDINEIMRWIPAWGFHTGQDSYLHDDGERWWEWKERVWYEILTWIMNLWILYNLFGKIIYNFICFYI